MLIQENLRKFVDINETNQFNTLYENKVSRTITRRFPHDRNACISKKGKEREQD